MKTKILFLSFALVSLSGCWLVEDKGATEVGSPVTGEADFQVTQPDPGDVTPSPEVPQEPTVEVPPNREDQFSFIIDDGAVYSHATQLKLSLGVPLFSYHQYKLSQNSACQGGTWASMDEMLSKDVTVSDFTQNSKVEYSVQFLDPDNKPSNCFSDSIIHDNKGPDILITKYPSGALEEGATGEIIFEVKDISPIIEVKCSLNGIVKTCFAGSNTINLSAMPTGSYEFSVAAKDIHGFQSSQKVTWNVVNKARYLSQTVQITQNKKVDVLVVIDNSGSMEYEQKSMANRVRNMLAILDGLDYRIAVTTTDPNPTYTKSNRNTGAVKYYGDGDLIPITNMGGLLWVDSTVNPTIAQYNLGLTLQRAETGSGVEQGINATYRLIEKASTPGHLYSAFIRPDAAFATLVISDEDESANGVRNDPQQLLSLIASRYNNQKAFSFHAIVTKPGDESCRNTYGAAYGERYKTIVELTGGVLGSVCETDYAAQVSGIATSIRSLVNSITLTCEPLPGYPITVKQNGAAYNGGFTVEGVNLKFANALDAGEYKVDYACLKQQ